MTGGGMTEYTAGFYFGRASVRDLMDLEPSEESAREANRRWID